MRGYRPAAGRISPRPQTKTEGTIHTKGDIKTLQNLNEIGETNIETFITLLRALTTNQIEEAAYFEENGVKYRIQITIVKQGESDFE